VPTYNRAAPLADLIGDILAQDYPPNLLELIVVDDGSTDETERLVREAQERSGIRLTYLRQARRGQAAARNRGVATAVGEIIAFTDSDCHVGPDWVRNAVALMTGRVALVSGPIRHLRNPERAPGFFHHQLQEFARENALHPTANAFYRRDALLHVGGFDERFGQCSLRGPANVGEDIDLAWRVRRAGFEHAFAEDAAVYHEASSMTPLGWITEPLAVYPFPRLVAMYPELRRLHLRHRLFLSDANLLFYLAVAGATVAGVRRQPAALFLAMPWVWHFRTAVGGDAWPPARWWRIPIKYGLMVERFALTAGTLLWSSARHRAVVL
jgi:glycosyltransferase involved in cell wall biosynthesis